MDSAFLRKIELEQTKLSLTDGRMSEDSSRPMEKSAARLLRNARREAMLALVLWAIFLCWTIAACIAFGYQHPLPNQETQMAPVSTDVPMQGGLPTWVFWGIALPWGLATLTTIGYGAFWVRDDDLSARRDETIRGDG